MNTAFSHALRVTICTECGAAVHASGGGGEVSCGVCDTVLDLPPRWEGEAPKEVDELERRTALEAQDGTPLSPSKDVLDLTVAGALTDETADRAMQAWQDTRRALQARDPDDEPGDDDPVALRFYFLTRLLYERLLPQEDDLMMRAILESAMEAVGHRRYRQTFRCMLACEAARVGDLAGSEDWLAPCDPTSRDIHADSVYRYSVSFVASHKKQWAQVIDALGPTHSDIPLAGSFDAMCTVLRANAHEKREDMGAAVYELTRGAERFEGGLARIETIIRSSGELLLCRRSYGRARKMLLGEEPSKGAAARPTSWPKILPWVVLSLAFFGIAVGVSDDAEVLGIAADLVFLVLGAAFTVPLIIRFVRQRSSHGDG